MVVLITTKFLLDNFSYIFSVLNNFNSCPLISKLARYITFMSADRNKLICRQFNFTKMCPKVQMLESQGTSHDCTLGQIS